MEIVWTDMAYESLKDVVNYIHETLGFRIASEVRALLYRKISLLGVTPQLGKNIRDTGRGEVRVLVVAKRSKIFYYLYSGKIYIIMIWDVRRNPESLEISLSRFLKGFPN